MQYDIYESLIDGTKEKKLSPKMAKAMFSSHQFKKMVSGEEIIAGIWKFWAEEAMFYKNKGEK